MKHRGAALDGAAHEERIGDIAEHRLDVGEHVGRTLFQTAAITATVVPRERPHAMPAVDQRLDEMAADEPARSRHQHHFRHLNRALPPPAARGLFASCFYPSARALPSPCATLAKFWVVRRCDDIPVALRLSEDAEGSRLLPSLGEARKAADDARKVADARVAALESEIAKLRGR